MWISRERKHSVHSEHPTPLGTWKRVLAPVGSSSVPVLGYASGHALWLTSQCSVEESGGRYNGAGIAGWCTSRVPQQRLSRRKGKLRQGGGQALEPNPKATRAPSP